MDAEALKDRLVVALDATGRFVPLAGALDGGLAGSLPKGPPRNPKARAYRCRVTVLSTRESDEPAGTSTNTAVSMRRAEVVVDVELSAPGEDSEPVHAETFASRLFDGTAIAVGEEGSPRTNAFHGALDAALSEAVAQLLLQLEAVGKTDAQLIADLASADGGVRGCAVSQLAERRNPAAVPALIEQLKSPEHPVVMKALGLLEAMHDQRAVKPLIDLTEKQDPVFVKQVVYVIGAIGGTDAEAFLYTEENGSQDAQVRAASAEAAAELRQRRAALDGGIQAARR
jgi:HEAT repeats